MPNCLEGHSLCTEANWGLPTQHFQKGIVVGINKKYQKKKKKTIWKFYFERNVGNCLTNVQITFLTKKVKNI